MNRFYTLRINSEENQLKEIHHLLSSFIRSLCIIVMHSRRCKEHLTVVFFSSKFNIGKQHCEYRGIRQGARPVCVPTQGGKLYKAILKGHRMP